jgi:NAD dependent epimerase/dehydratase family enzyme
VNFTSPNPVRNRDLTQALGRVLGRPAFLPAPAFMVRLILGEFGEVLLTGQKVLPRRLLEAGFEFHFPSIDQALENLLGN